METAKDTTLLVGIPVPEWIARVPSPGLVEATGSGWRTRIPCTMVPTTSGPLFKELKSYIPATVLGEQKAL